VYSIVLVHGGFGRAVTVVQNPTTSHADDVAVTTRALDQQPDLDVKSRTQLAGRMS
jgi:hypothetical protein